MLIALIRSYQVLGSPYFAGSCRFLPSCSEYAREAVAAHGATRGSYLAVRRLARCHPFCKGGHDPVPPAAGRNQTAGAARLAEVGRALVARFSIR